MTATVEVPAPAPAQETAPNPTVVEGSEAIATKGLKGFLKRRRDAKSYDHSDIDPATGMTFDYNPGKAGMDGQATEIVDVIKGGNKQKYESSDPLAIDPATGMPFDYKSKKMEGEASEIVDVIKGGNKQKYGSETATTSTTSTAEAPKLSRKDRKQAKKAAKAAAVNATIDPATGMATTYNPGKMKGEATEITQPDDGDVVAIPIVENGPLRPAGDTTSNGTTLEDIAGLTFGLHEINQVKKDGTKVRRVYGVDSDGNKHAVAHDKVLEAYGYGEADLPKNMVNDGAPEDTADAVEDIGTATPRTRRKLRTMLNPKVFVANVINGPERLPGKRKIAAILGGAAVVGAGIYLLKNGMHVPGTGGRDQILENLGKHGGKTPRARDLVDPTDIKADWARTHGTGSSVRDLDPKADWVDAHRPDAGKVDMNDPKAEWVAEQKAANAREIDPKADWVREHGGDSGSGSGRVLNGDEATAVPTSEVPQSNTVTFTVMEEWKDGDPAPYSWAIGQGVPKNRVGDFLTEVMGEDWSEKSRNLQVGQSVSATKEQIAKYAADASTQLPSTL